MAVILAVDFDSPDPDDEWLDGLGADPRCFVCSAEVATSAGVAVIGVSQTLLFCGPCAQQVGADLIADARELEIAMGLGEEAVRRVARLTRNVLRAGEDAAP
jgi:hypothetical protein